MRFNPRTRVGCDIRRYFPSSILEKFQSTHPRGVRPLLRGCVNAWLRFQSTHPRGVRPVAGSFGKEAVLFQSTHPRGVRPERYLYHQGHCLRFNPRTRVGCDVLCVLTVTADSSRFQSTHPRGVRLGNTSCDYRRCHVVSIHAPAWGATRCTARIDGTGRVSIHAPAWGATVSMFYPVNSRD